MTIKILILLIGLLFASSGWFYSYAVDNHLATGRSLYELEEQGELFAAIYNLPFGSKVKVTNPENGKSVVVEIVDRGGFDRHGRSIDLGRYAFSRLADLSEGVIVVKLEVLK